MAEIETDVVLDCYGVDVAPIMAGIAEMRANRKAINRRRYLRRYYRIRGTGSPLDLVAGPIWLNISDAIAYQQTAAA